MTAYENMIHHTSTPQAPWYVVPADHKWFVRMVMAIAIVDALERLHVDFQKPDRARLRELQRMCRAPQAS